MSIPDKFRYLNKRHNVSAMNKSDIVGNIARKLGLQRQVAEQAVESFFSGMTKGLADGKRVEIRGFGSFHPKAYDGYMGRNPKTGEDVPVAPKVQPFFKSGKEIKNVLNNK